MKHTYTLLYVLIISILLNSCSTSDKVITGGIIQKRKYQKGFYVEGFSKKHKTTEITLTTKNRSIIPTEEQKNAFPEELMASTNEEIIKFSTPKNVAQVDPATAPTQQIMISSLQEKNTTAETSTGYIKKVKKNFKKDEKNKSKPSSDTILYYILAILLPPLAVGLITNWDAFKTILTLLLWFCFILPGVIYAIYIVYKNT